MDWTGAINSGNYKKKINKKKQVKVQNPTKPLSSGFIVVSLVSMITDWDAVISIAEGSSGGGVVHTALATGSTYDTLLSSA